MAYVEVWCSPDGEGTYMSPQQPIGREGWRIRVGVIAQTPVQMYIEQLRRRAVQFGGSRGTPF